MKKPRANRFIPDNPHRLTLKDAAAVAVILAAAWVCVVLVWAVFTLGN